MNYLQKFDEKWQEIMENEGGEYGVSVDAMYKFHQFLTDTIEEVRKETEAKVRKEIIENKN